MNTDAINTLRFHCIGRFDVPGKQQGLGFIGKFRPFTELSYKDFEAIVNASETLYNETNENDKIDKDIIYQINGCAELLYNYALRDDAKLMKNKLITERERADIGKMFIVLMGIVAQLTNPHNRSFNGQSPLQIYRNQIF